MSERAAEIIRKLPGLKEDELSGPCALCGKPFVRPEYPPLFFRLRVERLAVDVNAVRRRGGLAMFFGSHAMAKVMGPNEDLAKVMAGPRDVFVCEPCVLEKFPELLIALEEESEDRQP